MGRKGETVSYTTPSFEEQYTSRLNEIKVQLKSVLYGDTPFVVGAEYDCKKKIGEGKECSGRIHIHSQAGKWYCLLCALRPGGQAPRWSKETRARVEEIMVSYPDPEKCWKEWVAKHAKSYIPPQEARMPKLPVERKEIDPERKAFGRRLREARLRLDKPLTAEQLASQLKKRNGGYLSPSTIMMYESGSVCPPDYMMEQLVAILELELEEVKV